MKSFSIVSTGTLKAIHGANFVLDYLVKSKPYFKNVLFKKIYSSKEELNIEKGDNMPIGEGSETSSYRMKRGVRTLLRKLLSSNYLIGARIKEYLNYIGPAKQVARKVMNDIEQSDWLIFQEFHSAYYYLKLKKKYSVDKKTALIIHQADDSCGQFFATFPVFNKNGRQKVRILKMRDYVYENIDRVIYISQKAYNGSIAPEEKRCMIYNGIVDIPDALRSCKKNSDYINLVCVGSISGRKGQDVIIESLALIPKEKRDFIKLYIVGEGSAKQDLEKHTMNLGLADNVFFMGLRSDVAEILSNMDVYIMPSQNEGLSISSIEALRAGLFLLLTDAGGNCEVMGNDCGMVVTRNPKDVAKKIEMIIDNNIISDEQKKRSVERFHQLFVLEKMAEGYERMILS